MKPRQHSVGLVNPVPGYLHTGQCTGCDFRVGFDTGTYTKAVDLAHAHVQDAYLEDLEAAGTIGE